MDNLRSRVTVPAKQRKEVEMERSPSPSPSKPRCSDCHGDELEDDHNLEARRKLIAVSIICVVFMIGEVVGGYFAGSLAIMTDAAHLLSDLSGFLISIFALVLVSLNLTYFSSGLLLNRQLLLFRMDSIALKSLEHLRVSS